MARSSGAAGLGTTLGFSEIDAGSYTLIAEITSIALDGVTVDKIELTHLASDGYFEESVPGVARPGTITLATNFYPDGFDAAFDILRVSKDWQITWPDAATFTDEGYIVNLGVATATEDKISGSLTIQLSGAPDWNESS